MVKVIETNISLNSADEFVDFQSRVIEIDSWDDYVSEVRDAKCVLRYPVMGSMYGNSIPQNARVEELVFNDFHLTCDVIIFNGVKTKKLAYLINEN